MPNLTIEQLQLFLLAVLPGVIAIKVYDLFYPPAKRDFGSSILEVLAYGLINFAIWVWPLLYINQKGFAEQHPIGYAVASFGILVLSPALLAGSTVLLRNRKRVAGWIGYPTKTAWDAFFKRQQECWILFHLKNGKMVGGFFSWNSYATSFPQQPEVYVEKVCRVNEDGEFVEIVEGTLGMVIRLADCQRLEFFVVEEEKTDGQEQKTEERRTDRVRTPGGEEDCHSDGVQA